MKKLILIFLTILLTSCSSMTDKQQRIVSATAIGGAIGNPLTAGIGALIGWLDWAVSKDSKSNEGDSDERE